MEAAIFEFRVILQRWAQGYSLDPIIASIQNMWTKTMADQELNQFANSLSGFMTRVVREPNYVTSQHINTDAEVLIDQGRTLLNAKYKADTETILTEGQIFLEKLNNDPMAREVAANFQKFAKHLFYDRYVVNAHYHFSVKCCRLCMLTKTVYILSFFYTIC